MSADLPLALGKGQQNYVTILTMMYHHAGGEICLRPQVVKEEGEGKGLMSSVYNWIL